MAWIRADITNKFSHLDVENVMQIESILNGSYMIKKQQQT